MTARVSVKVSGLVSPLRTMVSVIGVLGLPRMRFTASFSVMPFTDDVVELDDEVAGLDARAVGGRVLDGADHLDEAVFHADFDAEPAELALGADLQLLERFGVEVGRVRIQAGQHAVDGFGDQLLVVDRLDVVALDAAEDLGEGTQFLDRQRPGSVPLRDGR